MTSSPDSSLSSDLDLAIGLCQAAHPMSRGGSIQGGIQNGVFITENPMKMDEFRDSPISGKHQSYSICPIMGCLPAMFGSPSSLTCPGQDLLCGFSNMLAILNELL